MVKGDINAFRERFSRWKAGELVYDKGRPIAKYGFGKDEDTPTPPVLSVKAGDKVNTTQCAAWSNGWLRDNGYAIRGNAWNLKNVDVLYNGYSNMKKPSRYNRAEIELYNHNAADSVYKNFDSKTLDKSKAYAVNMFYNGSPALKEAYKHGDNVTGTHTGALVFNPSTNRWYVTHNIHGTIHQEPFVLLQSGKGKYGVTAVYQPRESGIINKIRGFFGFENGKDGEVVTNYSIPFIESKAIRLTNAGLATGARLSTNLLDSIADNAERAGLPLRIALGLATKESTLGNPTDDRSMRTLLSPLNRYALRNAGYGQHINSGVYVDGNELVNYYASDYNDTWEDPARGKSLLQKAFEFYKANPAKYNPGQKNHPKLVEKRGDEVMLSPEIQRWLTEREYAKRRAINGRKPEYVNSWFADFNDTLGADQATYKDGKDSGIHIKPSHRGRLTALKKHTGKSEAELYRTGGPDVRKMITFARNARKWHRD